MKVLSKRNVVVTALLVAATACIRLSYGTLLNRHDARHVISADQIRVLQADETLAERFVIVDVRDEAESNVSMIPGAISLAEFESDPKHQGKLVIAYCTIGVRSGEYAAMLRQDGWKALNYQGSILNWCENQLPLTTADGRSTRRVHTYSSRYSAPSGYQAVTQNEPASTPFRLASFRNGQSRLRLRP